MWHKAGSEPLAGQHKDPTAPELTEYPDSPHYKDAENNPQHTTH
jgi:hypothetical protein